MFGNIENPESCWAEVLDGYYYPLEPDKSDFSINTVATALSRQTRFGGHTGNYPLYSVAEHSIIVSEFVSEENAYEGLMHDATEAYLEDIKKPIKNILKEYKQLEEWCHKALSRYFSFQYPLPDEVKRMDVILGYNEGKLFGRNVDVWNIPPEFCVDDDKIKQAIKGMNTVEARRKFLRRFFQLYSRTGRKRKYGDPDKFMKPGQLVESK